MDEQLVRSRVTEGTAGRAVRDIATVNYSYNPVGPDAARQYGDMMYWKSKLQQPLTPRARWLRRDLRTD